MKLKEAVKAFKILCYITLVLLTRTSLISMFAKMYFCFFLKNKVCETISLSGSDGQNWNYLLPGYDMIITAILECGVDKAQHNKKTYHPSACEKPPQNHTKTI